MADATTDLILSIMNNIEESGWDAFSLVLEFDDGVRGNSGYLYAAESRPVAFSLDWDDIDAAVNEYLGGYYQPGDALPVRILVQFDRTSGQYDITMEDTDEDRWDVTPDNFQTMPEELRPKFD